MGIGQKIFIGYLLSINMIAFLAYGIDKRRAIKKRWRIPEKTLLGLAIIGGTLGALAGMYGFRHKTKHLKFVLGVPIILILQIGSVFGINAYVVETAKKHVLRMEEISMSGKKADAIIVLGAGVREDGSLSPMLQERLDMGIELYRQGVSDCLLMSGDHGTEHYDEVNTMKSYAIDNGIPAERIFMDHAGFSTYDTMYRAKEIFQVGKAVVVTQEYHLYRALYIANKLGLEADGVPCDTRTYSGQFYRWAREVLARNKDFWTVMQKPEPTYLGGAIPVSTDGNLTNDK